MSEGRGERTVAVIPARGGSKGIPRKNLALLMGRPLLAYAVEVGLACPEIDRVIVSTDDPEIARTALSLGAEVPFMRPSELAEDKTPDRPVFLHCVDWLKEQEGYEFDFLVNLRCTTPLKKTEHVRKALELIRSGDCDSVRTVDFIRGKHHPYWALKTDGAGYGVPFVDGIEISRYHQRQLLPPAYSINALVDVVRVSTLLAYENLYGKRMRLLVTDPLYSIDIDGPKDLILCEAIMERIHELV
ncbi:MAG: acylneuraminate cytidylyltransferase family protein [Desulfobacteraceae bacterium]|nr:MAG: acylneuraminate cytidylyltransferase family protein [Desulfobacteraceae bacterium]